MASNTDDQKISNENKLEFLKNLQETDPNSPALLSLSRSYMNHEQPEKAAEIAERVLSAHPDNMEAAYILGWAFESQGHTELAKEILILLDEKLKSLARTFGELGGLYESLNLLGMASRLHAAKSSLLADPTIAGEFVPSDKRADGDEEAAPEPIPTQTLAELYLSQGLEEKALEIYEKIIVADPENTSIQEKILTLRREANQEPETFAEDDKRQHLVDKLERLKRAADLSREALLSR